MQNIILSYPNRADAATITGGSWLTALPAQNLANREMWKVARSTDASPASTKFSVDLGADRLLRCFALANHNLSAEARWLVKVLTPEGGNNVLLHSSNVAGSSWEPAITFYDFSTSTEVGSPFGDGIDVTKFTRKISTGDLIFTRKVVTINPGTHYISIYLYIPQQSGVNSYKFQADFQDGEYGQTDNLYEFDRWVRVSVTKTTTVSAAFADFNLFVNGSSIPPVGFIIYATCAQIEDGGFGHYKPTTSAPSNIALLYSSQWQDVWQMVFDNLVEWESTIWWTGTAGDEYYRSPYPALLAMPDFTTARYITVEIDDTANPDGYVQIGRLFAGGGIQPATNASYGLQDSWRDLSTMDASESGSAWATERRRLRGVSFVIDQLTLAEAAYIHEMQRLLGTVHEVLYLPYPDDMGESQRYGFIGRLSELSAIEYPYFNSRSSAFKIEEIG